MSELARYATEHLLSLEHPVRSLAIGAAVGTMALGGAGINVSLLLHRVKHGGVVLHEGAKRVLRTTNFMFTGMSLYDWNDHLVHHPYSDVEDVEAMEMWNAGRPEGAPEAPIEVFRDPYSVILENKGGISTKEQLEAAHEGQDLGELAENGLRVGYHEVFFRTPALHRKAKQQINPFLYALDAFDKEQGITTRDHWPEHLRRVDMEDGDPDALRNKYPWLGLVALGVGEGLVLGAPAAVVAMGIHVYGLMKIGGVINSPDHFGEGKGFRSRYRVWSGKELPKFTESGELATVILPKLSVVFMGENEHKNHHDNPKYPYLAGSKIYKDIPGWIIYHLQKRGYAITPGAPDGPHDRPKDQLASAAPRTARQQRRDARIAARRQSIRQAA